MRFGSRRVCNIVIKDITNKKPTVYLDTLKMNSIDTGVTTVYAKGGAGNTRLIGWSGNKEVKFENEDALLSPESFAVLSGSKLKKGKKIIHKKESFEIDSTKKITLSHEPTIDNKHILYVALSDVSGTIPSKELTKTKSTGSPTAEEYDVDKSNKVITVHDDLIGKTILVDYYYMSEANITTLTITSDDFPETFMLEADTLFRTEDGVDRPCHVTIPKAKLEGKFKITMKSEGDPATFKFDFECLKPSNGTEMVVFDIEMDEE